MNTKNFLKLLLPLLLIGCSHQHIAPTAKINPNQPCWQHLMKFHGNTDESMTAVINHEIHDYESLVEMSLTHRAKTIRLAKHLKQQISEDKPLSGADLDELNKSLLKYLKIRKKFYKIAELHECWLNLSAFKSLTIKPISDQEQLKAVMLSLSAALLLYDNYLLAISIFEEDEKLRRVLNTRDSGYGIGQDELQKITRSYNSYRKRKRIQKALRFYSKRVVALSKQMQNDQSFRSLKLLIDQSPSYHLTLKKKGIFYIFGRKLQFMNAIGSDKLYSFGNDGLNLFSKFFGNSIGLIESRKGLLYNRADVLTFLNNKLKAGDILLEKTPFRLTDKFIPGHWGHAAIWIGTESELKQLKIWHHPVVKKYHHKIRQAKLVVEALRPGVQLNSLQHFLNIDDLAILRDTKMDNNTRAERIILALRQLGKEYDFNFDVETTDKIVCSELIYIVYTGISWPTNKTLGRFTISPDNVASKALKKGPLKLISLFHNGKYIVDNPLRLLSQLIQTE
ncbi:YiiX/YebB-like N1pC/P60 family cysteine hydrolase [Candidatus Marithrix sp. Canyon 246]|uniref:YiiX/YebB-like N1pC/P60 family cysteine hydrolase n=1 Tax=Candidatus Marithrix sp. Canyon 246 TaxID=1827136 RepID=UPI000849EE60|nr:YiiX/YebB-like N1pC/P60 family cysteine hydrolase [Candidatus Marithrix sp. Canyon 246]